MRRKKALNVLDVRAIVRELRGLLTGGFLEKAYTMGDSVLLRIRREGEKYHVLINAHRIGLTRYISESEKGWEGVAGLRRLTEGLRIKDVRAFGLDRIVIFELEKGSLIAELLEPWNVIYVDENNVVKWSLRAYKGRDREVRPGLQYTPPPRLYTGFDEGVERVREAISRYDTIGKALAKALGLGGELSDEVCKRLNVEPAKSPLEIDVEDLIKAIEGLFRQVENGVLEPMICYSNGLPITVVPVRFISLNCDSIREFKSFNEAVDEYFHTVEFEEMTRRKLEVINAEIARLERSIAELELRAGEFRKGAEELRAKAQMVLAYKYQIDELLETLRRLWASEKGPHFADLVRGIEHEGVRVKDFDVKNKAVLIEAGGVSAVIPLNSDAGSIVENLFNRAKELERKAKHAEEVLEELRRRLEGLKAEGERIVEALRESTVRILYGVKEWFERFRWFVTSGGFLALGGRDASQNEVLVRNYLRPWDLFIHADIPGGSCVILRLPQGATPSETDVLEAAQFAAAYSKAWVLGLSCIDVFYVRGEQVSKRAPSGEYLGRGSFMVYGQRGWARSVELAIGIGVRIDRIGDMAVIRLVAAPPSVIGRLANYYAVLRPGNRDRTSIAKELYEAFKARVFGLQKAIPIELIVDAVPGPSRIEGFEEGSPMAWDDVKRAALT